MDFLAALFPNGLSVTSLNLEFDSIIVHARSDSAQRVAPFANNARVRSTASTSVAWQIYLEQGCRSVFV